MRTLRWALAATLATQCGLAFASDNAADLLKAVTDFRADLVSKAQEKAKPDQSEIDFAAIQKQVQAKAADSLKGIDPSKVSATDSLDWAQLFELAGRPKDTETVLVSFIGTKPEGAKLFVAQSMLLGASWENMDEKTLASTLQSMKPYDSASSLECARLIADYAPGEATVIGDVKSIELIDKSLGAIDQSLLTPSMKEAYASIKAEGTMAKIEILENAGQKDKALTLIAATLVSAEEPLKSDLVAAKNQLAVISSPAPALKSDRAIGTFSSIESFKGKVVVLDFFAHWCPPCKDALPELRQLLADLQPRGLEVIGVTQCYGYLGDPSKKLTPDEEFAKMADFVKENKISWPIVFGPNDNFQAYGVTAVPEVVVISRTGIVHSLEVGYSRESFAEFRKKVEEFLGEK